MDDFQYIDSLTCYGVFRDGAFERLVQSRREVWFGADGSGLLRSQFVRSVFFNDEQRARWEGADRAAISAADGSSDTLFAPYCWNGPRAWLKALPQHASLTAALERRGPVTLHEIKQIIGEALVPKALRRQFFELCVKLDGTTVSEDAVDQLGRHGIGIARDERAWREQLIFDSDSLELIGTRQLQLDDQARFAPVGAVTGWTCFMDRRQVMSLPDGLPPTPGPPCAQPGAGRGTPIRPGFTLSTGYFTDLKPHADQWLSAGIISENDHATLYARQDQTDRIHDSRPEPPPVSEGGPL